MASKSQIRQELLAQRRALSPSQQSSLGGSVQEACLHFIASLSFEPSTVGLYAPILGEVPTQALFRFFAGSGAGVFYPRVDSASDSLHYLAVQKSSELVEGSYQIPEPPVGAAKASSLDLMIVPGVAFDTEGRRLGYGKGYYDRLKDFPVQLRIGLAYDFQIVSSLPQEEHDLLCDVVVSEKRLIKKERLL